jgi:hypothetical protein
MPRKPIGQILEHTARNGVVSYSVRFRGRELPGRGDPPRAQ